MIARAPDRKTIRLFGCFLSIPFFLAATVIMPPAMAQQSAQQADMPDAQKNPFAGDPAAVAAGKTLYDANLPIVPRRRGAR